MDFLIATHNMKKRAELERILKPIGVRVLLAEEAGVELPMSRRLASPLKRTHS